jgi:hypothetical protein
MKEVGAVLFILTYIEILFALFWKFGGEASEVFLFGSSLGVTAMPTLGNVGEGLESPTRRLQNCRFTSRYLCTSGKDRTSPVAKLAAFSLPKNNPA